MGIWHKIRSLFRGSPENPNTPLSELFGGSFQRAKAGVTVSEKNSLALAAVWNAVKVLSDSLAQVPLKVYQIDEQGNKQEFRQHPLWMKLKEEPNKFMSSPQLRETMMIYVLLWGNAYARIKFSSVTARPTQITPVQPWRVEIKMEDTELLYIIDGQEKVPAAEMIHVPGMSFDGIQGMSPIQKHREAIGTGLAATEYGGQFFGNGANVRGVAESDHKLSDTAYQRISESLGRNMQGNANAHGVAVLEEGLKYKNIGMPPADAQYIETSKFQVDEVARIFNLPPHMLAKLDDANYANVSAMALRFVKHSVMPWAVKFEQEFRRKMLFEREKRDGDVTIEFTLDGLLRADIETRSKWYKIAIQNGIMTPNEVRKKENLNKIPGQADNLLVPTNNTDNTGDTDEDRIIEEIKAAEDLNGKRNGTAVH